MLAVASAAMNPFIGLGAAAAGTIVFALGLVSQIAFLEAAPLWMVQVGQNPATALAAGSLLASLVPAVARYARPRVAAHDEIEQGDGI